jgi:hypothetical protein
VVVDTIDPPPLCIEGAKPGWILIGLSSELGSSGAAGDPPESSEIFGRFGSTLARDGFAQSGIGREQVHVGKRRALVEIRFRFASRGHDSSPPLVFFPSLSCSCTPRNKNEGAG